MVDEAFERNAESLSEPERIGQGIANCARVTRMGKRNVGRLAPNILCALDQLPQCLKFLHSGDAGQKDAMTTECLCCTKAKSDVRSDEAGLNRI